MVETISPVVHGGRRAGYWASVASHVVGAVLTAALVGTVLGAVGALLGAPWRPLGMVLLALVAALYAARAVAGLGVPIPVRRAQVPDWWRTFFSPPLAAFLYGAGLGVGFLTILSFGTYVAVAVGALASGDPLLGAAVCAPFGLARGLSVLVGTRASAAGAGEVVVRCLEDLGRTVWPRALDGAASTGIALVALGRLL